MIRLNSTLRLIPAILVFLILALAGQASAVEWRFEVGTVDLPATDESSTFRPVVFRQAYSVPPVVVVLSSSVDGDPVTVRVRGVTTTGFELVQVEPGGEDGPHGAVEVHYLAVFSGRTLSRKNRYLGSIPALALVRQFLQYPLGGRPHKCQVRSSRGVHVLATKPHE